MAVEGIGHWPVKASKKRKTKDERTDVDGIAQSHRCLYCKQLTNSLQSPNTGVLYPNPYIRRRQTLRRNAGEHAWIDEGSQRERHPDGRKCHRRERRCYRADV